MAKKSGNTVEYRDAKRITAFVSPRLKGIIKAAAKSTKRSVSQVVGEWLALAHKHGAK